MTRKSRPLHHTLAIPFTLLWIVPAVRAQIALEPVVVTGSGFERRAFDTPYSVGVVEADALRAGGLMVNLSEAMARVPGLNVGNRSNYAQDLQISSRGFGARSTFGVRGLRLYSDGIPATMPDGQGQVAHFDLASAQRIEVLRGPFSALYGNSSGGVISLFSAPVSERYAEIAVDAGRYGTQQLRATVQAPLSDTPGRGFDLRVGVSRFQTDGFRPQSEAKRTLGNVRIGWTGEADTVIVTLSQQDQPALDPLGLTRTEFNANPYQTNTIALPQDAPGQPARFNTRKEIAQQQGGAIWRHRFDGDGALRESAVTAYHGHRSVTQWQSIPDTVPTQTSATGPGGVIDFDRGYTGLDGRLIWRWTLGDELGAQFIAGAAYDESREARRGYQSFVDTSAGRVLGVTGAPKRNEANTVRSSDVYAQGELEFSSRWVGTLGVRSGKLRFRSDDSYIVGTNGDDSGSLAYRYTNPVAAIQFRASPALNLYVSAGRGFESPTFNELAYRPAIGGVPQTGFNSTLAAQKSKQVELGAKWRPAGTGVALDAAVFEARTDDEIGVLTNTGGRSTFQNVGHTTRRGAEIGTSWKASPEWQAAMALTWLTARYDDSPATAPTIQAGNRIAGTSPRSGYAELAYHPGGRERTELAAEWRAQGAVPVNDLNSDAANGWATAALRARQQYVIGTDSKLELLMRVDNLFNRVYAGSVIVNDGNGRFFEPGAPRSWLVGLTWRQGF